MTKTKNNIADIRSVCVFCGSGSGKNPKFSEGARRLGKDIADSGMRLVYGGGSLGLMGETARSVLDNGGHVTGIIPAFLSEREKMLKDVQELIVTDDMHERKSLMFQRSDAIVALPGGIGPLEELVEQLTWSQLGQHTKPIVVADLEGYWTPLLQLFEQMRGETFIRPGLEVGFHSVSNAADIVQLLQGLEVIPISDEAEKDLTDHF